MSSYLIDSASRDGDRVELLGDEARHAAKAARRTEGEGVWLIDGKGTAFEAVVEATAQDRVTCRIVRAMEAWGEPEVEITLAAAVLKGGNFDVVVEKATELGVSRIIPLESERAVAKGLSKNKRKRWESLALSATKQCRRSRVPEIAEPMSTEELGQSIGDYDHAFVAWVGERSRSLSSHEPLSGSILVIIGPEGGFSDEEAAFMVQRGAHSVTLGNRRLRAETAALCALTLVMDRAGELKKPMEHDPDESGTREWEKGGAV